MKLRNKKTGEISTKIDVSQDNKSIWVFGKHSRIYRSLAELNEEWEDYTPAEPIIDDKKLRNIIKEWCEYYHISRLQYRPLYGNEGHYLVNESGRYSIDVDIDCLTQFEFYTVEELCGEKEEW